MRLKVLGAYGASDAEHNLTGYLIDDWLAVDAGTLTSKLSLAQQARIQAWSRLARDLDLGKLARTTQVVGLAEVPAAIGRMFEGKVRGRTVVDVNA